MPAPFHSRLASPASAPAGGSSMTAVTPRSRMVARQASKRTGLVTWLTSRASASAPVGTAVPSALDSSSRLGSAGRGRRRPPSSSSAGRGHVVGVEGAGDRQRHDPRLRRRVGLQRGQPVERSRRRRSARRRCRLAGGQAVLVEGGEHLVGVAAEDGGHAGRRLRAGGGHRPAADGGQRDRPPRPTARRPARRRSARRRCARR